MAFNRDRNSRSGGDRGGFNSRPSFRGGRGGFGDRGGSRGPVEMHQAVCDNCGRNCEVPFRPTQGKPIYCNDCFADKQRARPQGDFKRYNQGPEGRDEQKTSQLQGKINELNIKLDKILSLLAPAETKKIEEPLVEEVVIDEAKKKTPSKKLSRAKVKS